MNILLINHYAGSFKHGMEFRPYYTAREWIKAGHKVRVVTADFSHLRSYNPGTMKDLEIEEIDGIEYQWLHTSKYVGNGVKRAITIFQFCTKLWIYARKLIKDFSPDVVITSSTYPLDTFPAQKIAKIAKAKYIHEGHDIWPLTLTELIGMSKWNPFVIVMGIAERSVYKNADHVVSVLPFSWKHMLEHGLQSKDKFTHIPNGVVLSDWENPTDIPEEHERLLKDLKAQNKKIFCYLGEHGVSNALDVLIDAALKTTDDSVAYVFVGKGNQKERLMKKAEGAKNIWFLPPVNKKSVPTLLSKADFLYTSTGGKCPLYRYGVSINKVYDYMMSGKPIIFGSDAANNDIADAECGITVVPGDSDAVVEGLGQLLKMSDSQLEEMGRNGKKAVMEKYNYDVLARTFLDIMCD